MNIQMDELPALGARSTTRLYSNRLMAFLLVFFQTFAFGKAFATPTQRLNELDSIPQKECSSLRIFLYGFWQRIRVVTRTFQTPEKLNAPDRIYSPMIGQKAQIEVLRQDGLIMTYVGVILSQEKKGFKIIESATSQERIFNPNQIYRLYPVQEWTGKSGLVQVFSEDRTTKKFILGHVKSIDTRRNEMLVLPHGQRDELSIPIDSVLTFTNLSNFLESKTQKVAVFMHLKSKKGEISLATSMDLEQIDWEKGELIFSHPDNPNDFEGISANALLSFHTFFKQ
jgi:hypothetical protein